MDELSHFQHALDPYGDPWIGRTWFSLEGPIRIMAIAFVLTIGLFVMHDPVKFDLNLAVFCFATLIQFASVPAIALGMIAVARKKGQVHRNIFTGPQLFVSVE